MTLFSGEGQRYQTASIYVPRPSQEQAGKSIARLALTAGMSTNDVARVRMAQAETGTVKGMPFGALIEAAA